MCKYQRIRVQYVREVVVPEDQVARAKKSLKTQLYLDLDTPGGFESLVEVADSDPPPARQKIISRGNKKKAAGT